MILLLTLHLYMIYIKYLINQQEYHDRKKKYRFFIIRNYIFIFNNILLIFLINTIKITFFIFSLLFFKI